MSGSLDLSEDEIDALRQGIADGSISTSDGVKARGLVEPFALGAGDGRELGDLHALGLMNERLAKAMRAVFQPLLRVAPRVSAASAELRTFDAYLGSLPPFLSLNVIRIEPLGGNGLIAFEPELVGALVDAWYGGKGTPPTKRATEFTPAEDRLIQSLTERLLEALGKAWSDVSPLVFTVVSAESDPQFAAFVEDSDDVLVTRFSISLPSGAVSSIDITYPFQALKPLLPLLRSKVISESISVSGDAGWTRRLKTAVMDIDLPVRSILAEPVIPLGDVMALRVGDILPIQVPEVVRLLVDRTPFRLGSLGEAKGAAAVMIR